MEEQLPDLVVLDALPDVVLAFDDTLTIKYINPFGRRVFEHEDTVLADQNLVEFVHPDDLGRAAEVAGLIQHDALMVDTTPAYFRAQTRTGRWITIEINATPRIERGPLAGLIVVVGRVSADPLIRDQILEMLTAGRPTDEIVDLIPQYGLWRHPRDHYAVVYTDSAGELRRVGSGGALDLLERFDGPGTPWQIARDENREVLHQWADLMPSLQAAATELGMQGCMAMPVADRMHDQIAYVVGWSSRANQDVGAHRYALEQMARSLDVIMQWRQHVTGLERAARFDSLSGVANRAEFFRRCADELAAAKDTGNRIAVLYLDLDGFKDVNDTSGHAAGDAVIVGTAQRLAHSVRSTDVVARLGGDEFAVLCTQPDEVDAVTAIADRLIAHVNEPFEHHGEQLRVGASVGIARSSPSDDVEDLLARADAALYVAKADGKGRWILADDQ